MGLAHSFYMSRSDAFGFIQQLDDLILLILVNTSNVITNYNLKFLIDQRKTYVSNFATLLLKCLLSFCIFNQKIQHDEYQTIVAECKQ